MKKGILISASLVGALFILLLLLPVLFKGKITQLAKDEINNMLTAKVDFGGFDMSFIRNFPHASFRIKDLQVIGTEAFEKDTLFSGKSIDLVINLSSLFSDKGYEITKLALEQPRIFLHTLPDGRSNWDIMKDKEEKEQVADTADMNFNFKLKKFTIEEAALTYRDDEGEMQAEILGFNLSSSGDLAADSSLLKTQLRIASLSFGMEGIEYISKATAEVDADINANLNDFIFTFSKNTSRFNAIAFSLDGSFQLLEPEGFYMDLKLNAPEVDFKSILSLIPSIYSRQFESLTADGKVALSAFVKGKMLGDLYPAFDVNLSVADAWFRYPALPQSVQNIQLALSVSNPGGELDLTKIDLSRFSFLMGNNPFSATARVTQPLSDPDLKLNAKGKLDLGMIKDVYPLEEGSSLNGVFTLDLNLNGRMSYYEKNQFDRFTFAGNMSISDLSLTTSALPQQVIIPRAALSFNNRYADLSALQLRIGKNDMQASGKLENFLAYALRDQTLKGKLILNSNYLNINDFMKEEVLTQDAKQDVDTEEEALSLIEVPKNIDFVLQANFKELLYDNMRFNNAKGVLRVENGEMKFQDMTMQAFGGSLGLKGTYSTADLEKPFVNMDFAITDVFFTEIFKQVETIRKFAPVFEQATGKFSTKLSFNTLLKQDMMPDLNTVSAKGSLATKTVGLKEIPALNELAAQLKKPELSNLLLKNLSLLFFIKDGRLNMQPFDVKAGDFNISLSGSSGLDQSLALQGKIRLPDVLNMGRFSTLPFSIGGTFTRPVVRVDLAETVNAFLDEAKTAVKAEVDKKVGEIKEKADAEIQKQKEAALREYRQQADKLRAEAKALGDKIVEEAQKQSDALVEKAENPIAKKVAELSGKKLVEEARKQADELYRKADEEAIKWEEKMKQL